VLDTGKEPGTVVEVVQAGYVMAGRLLRPAMVGVAKAPAPDSGAESGGDPGASLDTEV
jgi:molecular chaperone GrpE